MDSQATLPAHEGDTPANDLSQHDQAQQHFRSLERMYMSAPINLLLPPRIAIAHASAEVHLEMRPEYFHSAGAAHGSVLFKLLDDSAFFAANSLEQTFVLLTAAFTTYLTRPVSQGVIRTCGKVVNQTRTQFLAESIAYDNKGRELGRGNGIFVRARIPLMETTGYSPAWKPPLAGTTPAPT